VGVLGSAQVAAGTGDVLYHVLELVSNPSHDGDTVVLKHRKCDRSGCASIKRKLMTQLYRRRMGKRLALILL
jgi:hypothetical protein